MLDDSETSHARLRVEISERLTDFEAALDEALIRKRSIDGSSLVHPIALRHVQIQSDAMTSVGAVLRHQRTAPRKSHPIQRACR